MALYREIHLTFWTDTKVSECFTPEDKYFMLYCLTNPHTNIIGCYEIGIKQISDELGYSKECVESLLIRFGTSHKVIEYDKSTRELFIKNWCKYNWSTSCKLDKPILAAIKAVKCDKFRNRLIALYNARSTVSIPYRYGIDTTITNTNTNTNTITNTNTNTITNTITNQTKKFVQPTLEEVRTYCEERGNKVDAEKFIDYYQSNGWKVGKNPMKDWKAAVRTWERKETPKQEQETPAPRKTVSFWEGD